jgi:hypothetical protein
MRIILTLGIALFLLQNAYAQSVQLKFNNNFGSESFAFKKEYTTAFGEKLTFTTLNYFISNIKLIRKDGTEYVVPQDSSYFLIKQADSASKTIVLNNIPEGKYKAVGFTIGVDSVRNTLPVDKRTGALDVGAAARGMYWVWNSGYIFFKLEGKTVNDVDSLRKNFQYHIGGYGGFDSKTINNIKVKTLEVKKLVVSKKKQPIINIQVDIAKFFDNTTPIKVAEHRSVMWGDLSVKIADNYFSIFNIGNIIYQ